MKIKNFVKIYEFFLRGLLLAVFLTMFTVTVTNVFMRYVLNSPIPWAGELARYSFVWVIFLGGAIAMRRGNHIGMEFLQNSVPEKMKKVLFYLIYGLVIAFLGVFIFIGFRMALMSWDTHSSVLRMPMSFPYLALPIGGIPMLVEAVRLMRFGPSGS